MRQQIMYNIEVHESILIMKWEEFPALIDLIGLIISIDYQSICDNQFQSRFPAQGYTCTLYIPTKRNHCSSFFYTKWSKFNSKCLMTILIYQWTLNAF